MGEQRRHDARMLWIQIRHHNRTFWRNPLGAFFTVVFPLVLLLILGGLFGDSLLVEGVRWVGPDEEVAGAIPFAQVITPSIAAFAVAMACFVQLATSTAGDRANGTLKRLRGTPLPPAVHLAGRVASSVWIASVCVAAVLVAGAVLTEMTIDWGGLGAAVVIFTLGAVTFGALGLMVVSLARPGSVQAVAFGTLLPLSFISEIFLHGSRFPSVLSAIGWTFPLRHLAVASRRALDPAVGGTGFAWGHIAVIAAWGIAAAAIAAWRFSWDPGGPRRSSRRTPAGSAPPRRRAEAVA